MSLLRQPEQGWTGLLDVPGGRAESGCAAVLQQLLNKEESKNQSFFGKQKYEKQTHQPDCAFRDSEC